MSQFIEMLQNELKVILQDRGDLWERLRQVDQKASVVKWKIARASETDESRQSRTRDLEALALRRGGMNYREIGEKFGIGHGSAARMVFRGAIDERATQSFNMP